MLSVVDNEKQADKDDGNRLTGAEVMEVEPSTPSKHASKVYSRNRKRQTSSSVDTESVTEMALRGIVADNCSIDTTDRIRATTIPDEVC